MEQYKKITKQISGVYLLKITDFLVMFLLFVVLSRFLSKYEYGVYSILSVTILLISSFLTLALNDFIIKDLTGAEKNVKNKYFSQIFTFSFIFNLGATFLILIAAFFVLNLFGFMGVMIAAIMSIFTSFLLVIGAIISAYFFSEKRTVTHFLIEFLLKGGWAVPLMLMLILRPLGIDSIFLIRLISTFLVILIVVLYLKKISVNFFSPVDPKYIRKALIFSIPLLAMLASQWVITSSDRYVLGFFHSAIEVANYSYIYSLLNTIFLFCVAPITLTLYPYLLDEYRNNQGKKVNFLFNSMFKYMLLLIVPALTAFTLLVKEIITLISGVKYLEVSFLVPFLIVFPLFSGLLLIPSYDLLLKNKSKYIGLYYTISMILNLILNFILIPKYGVIGASIATSITYAFLFLILYIKTRKNIKLDYKYLKIPQIIISTIIMSLSIAFIKPTNIYSKLGTIALGAVVYLVSLILTRAYVKEEISLIVSFLPGFIRKIIKP